MSDERVADALRSEAPLVVVEAPAGFGKTYQGAEYARFLAPRLDHGRMLILTHTNAACDVFARRTKGLTGRVEIRTLYSLIIQIAATYHHCLGLPHDVNRWAHGEKNGYGKVAARVARLLEAAPAIPSALVSRYPVIVCDEHQDSIEAQHRVVVTFQRHGSKLRVFADPMQAIYSDSLGQQSWENRWAELQGQADRAEELTTPHRWRSDAQELGEWIGSARDALRAGWSVDLRGQLPPQLTILRADNRAQRHGMFQMDGDQRRPINRFINSSDQVLVLAATNSSVRGLRSFFGRRIPIWEGHTRGCLEDLVKCCSAHAGDAEELAAGVAKFVRATTTGLSQECKLLISEAKGGCTTRRRGKPAKLQDVARRILDSPDYRGVADAISAIAKLIPSDAGFRDANLDLPRACSH